MRDLKIMRRAPERRARLDAARLYLIAGPEPGGRALADVLGPALAGGVDIFQLRAKDSGDDELLEAAAVARDLCDAAGALLVINDRPDLAREAQADGVHVGQGDAPVELAREQAGHELLVGLSTHSPAQLDAAHSAGADYIGVGPVHATPTKPGRPAAGLELVRFAASRSRLPWFAIGGIDAGNVHTVCEAGAGRIAVVRAIEHAPDPRAAAAELRLCAEGARSRPIAVEAHGTP